MPENYFQNKPSLHQHHLETLIEYTLTLNSLKDFNKVVNHFLLTLMGKFLISKIAFYISDKSKLKLVQSKGINIDEKFYEVEFSDFKIQDNSLITELKDYHSLNHFKEIRIEKKLIGLFFFSFHSFKNNFNDNEVSLFESIISLTSVVIENLMMIENLNEINRILQTKISQTKSLFELSKEFSLLLNETDVYKFLSYTVMGNFMTNKFALIGVNEKQKVIIGSNFDNEKFQNFIDELDINSIDSSIFLENFNSNDKIQRMGISLIIPLEMKNKTTGLMICGEKMTKHSFTPDEIEFLESLGSIAAISLENIRLFREMLEKLEEDIRIAKEIQKNFLPKSFPKSTTFEIFGMNLPSKKVGGDYFDCFRINEEKIVILIADVVGKGIPASLIMSNLQAMIKTICSKHFEIREATRDINNLMRKNLSIGNFITFFWGILDEKNKTLEYVNAGHNPPFLIRHNEVIKLAKGGIILGIMDLASPYDSETIKLCNGDLICLYTDGFIEATNENEEEFTELRFRDRLMNYKNQPLEIITNKLIDEILSFSSNPNEIDDLTILLTRVI